MTGADLECAKLCGASLERTTLNSANLTNANFERAILDHSHLERANLTNTYFHNASLANATLNEAYLEGTNFTEASLEHANLTSAQLLGTVLERATLSDAELLGAKYEPTTTPSEAHLTGLKNLDKVRFDQGKQGGLVLLRTAFEKLGLRDLERSVNLAINRGIDEYKIGQVKEATGFSAFLENIGEGGVAFIRRVTFDCTTEYGFNPGHALKLLVISWFAFGVIYSAFVWEPFAFGVRYFILSWRPWHRRLLPHEFTPLKLLYDAWAINDQRKYGGIYLIVSDRIQEKEGKYEINEEAVIEHIRYREWWQAGRWGLQFSLLSAFDIGFREITIGNWIRRIQKHEYALRAEGMVRVIAGLQSLLSVYLVAMWVLTYFGRPFQ